MTTRKFGRKLKNSIKLYQRILTAVGALSIVLQASACVPLKNCYSEIISLRDDWFAKTRCAGGIAILGSANVNDVAMQQAEFVIFHMFSNAPQIQEQLSNSGFKLVIYNDDIPGEKELIPNLSKPVSNKGTYDYVAITAVTWDDDLICDMEDKNTDEGWSQYTIHEIAHALRHLVIERNEDLKARLAAAFNNDKTYAIWNQNDIGEYWAEAVTAYFGTYWNPSWDGGTIPNRQITKNDLERVDNDVYLLINDLFNGVSWTPSCP